MRFPSGWRAFLKLLSYLMILNHSHSEYQGFEIRELEAPLADGAEEHMLTALNSPMMHIEISYCDCFQKSVVEALLLIGIILRMISFFLPRCRHGGLQRITQENYYH